MNKTMLALIFAAGAVGNVQAALNSSLTFKDPTGIVGPNDNVDLWVTFSLDNASDPLKFSNSPFTFAPTYIIPTEGRLDISNDVATFASYTQVQSNTSFWCSGTFTNVCDPGAYRFDFHTDNSDPAKPSFNWLESYSLAAGESRDYLFGTFSPAGGPVTAGTYTFYGTEFFLALNGVDANNTPMGADLRLGLTCNGDPACAFTRTVAAVPEAQTWVMLVAGLGLVGWQVRRRRTA